MQPRPPTGVPPPPPGAAPPRHTTPTVPKKTQSTYTPTPPPMIKRQPTPPQTLKPPSAPSLLSTNQLPGANFSRPQVPPPPPTRMGVKAPPKPPIMQMTTQRKTSGVGGVGMGMKVPIQPTKKFVATGLSSLLGKRPSPAAPSTPMLASKLKKMIPPKIQPKKVQKKKVKKAAFSLGENESKNLMEDYLGQSGTFNCFFPFFPSYARNVNASIAKETRMRIKDMKLNPQNYFNFGKTKFVFNERRTFLLYQRNWLDRYHSLTPPHFLIPHG